MGRSGKDLLALVVLMGTAVFLSVLNFAYGPGFFFAAEYVGAFLFVLGVAISGLMALGLVLSSNTSLGAYAWFSSARLITSLIKQDGLRISDFMLAVVSKLISCTELYRLVGGFGRVLRISRDACFVWRRHCLGHPLASPLFKNGQVSFLSGLHVECSLATSDRGISDCLTAWRHLPDHMMTVKWDAR